MTDHPPPGWTERTERQHHQPPNPFRPEGRWTPIGENDTPAGPVRRRRVWYETWQTEETR